MSFLESWIFELFAVKSQISKQGLSVSASIGFYQSPSLILAPMMLNPVDQSNLSYKPALPTLPRLVAGVR